VRLRPGWCSLPFRDSPVINTPTVGREGSGDSGPAVRRSKNTLRVRERRRRASRGEELEPSDRFGERRVFCVGYEVRCTDSRFGIRHQHLGAAIAKVESVEVGDRQPGQSPRIDAGPGMMTYTLRIDLHDGQLCQLVVRCQRNGDMFASIRREKDPDARSSPSG
jgi:hypothetical protein